MNPGTRDYLQLIERAAQAVRWIHAEQLVEAVRAGALLLDVREAEERAGEPLAAAIPLSRGLLELRIHQHCPDKDRVLICCCGTGTRSVLAAQTLRDLGYREVRVLKGGLLSLDDRTTAQLRPRPPPFASDWTPHGPPRP